MQATPTIKFTEHVGRWLRRAWAGVAYCETRVTHWLGAYGISFPVSKLLLLSVKAILVTVLLYVGFWVVLLLGFAWAAAWLARNVHLDDEKQPELRDGHSGIGVYDKNDWRIDMRDPDEP